MHGTDSFTIIGECLCSDHASGSPECQMHNTSENELLSKGSHLHTHTHTHTHTQLNTVEIHLGTAGIAV